jgi:hypothetical protein
VDKFIFLYSSFRTSSTWLFSRFRVADGLVAFNEIFNEDLARITREEAATRGPDSRYSKHPPGPAYFSEFIPLIRDAGGVTGFEESMAFETYVPSDGLDGKLTDSEAAYIQGLAEHARSLNRVPLLCCTRSLGRAKAIAAAFPGFHVLIYRNIFQQWCSFCEQNFRSTSYFLETVGRTIKANLHDPFFRRIDDLFPSQDIEDADAFSRFALLHLYLYGQIFERCTLTVDVNRLARDPLYRAKSEADINDACGISIDLSNVKESIAFTFTELGTAASFAETLRKLEAIVNSEIASASGRRFVSQAVADACAEYEKYCFYAGSLAKAAGPQGMLGQIAALREELASKGPARYGEMK